jgi:colanic acid biosynthesis glycosyl transferase WcaI
MRILILNQFFYPDHSATSQLMTDLAEQLVERGFQVTALAGRGRYTGGEALPRREIHNRVRIVRAWATNFGKANIAGRLCDYLSFYVGAALRLLLLPKHDVIMVLTTPPLIGVVAVAVGRLKRTPVFSLMQDIYPDVAIELGTLRRGSLLSRVLDWLSRGVLRASNRIIVLGECMRERILEKLDGQSNSNFRSRIDTIHNWADGVAIKPVPDNENTFAAENGLSGRFIVMFSGNLGKVNDFDTVLESARLLKARNEIQFVFIGDGAKKRDIQDYIRTNDLSNIVMLPYQPREALPQSIAAGHASLVTLAEGLAGLSVPSKTYAIMAAGRPILFVGDRKSSVARLVKRCACGEVISAGDSGRLARVIEGWAGDRRQPERMGRNGRITFEKYFDRKIAVDSYIKSFSKCGAPDVAAHVASELADSRVVSG